MLTSMTLALLLGANPSINDCVPANFRSATFVARKVTGNQRELAKINKDFGMSYRFSSTTVSMEEPFKLRMESKVDDSTFLFIVNGVNKVARAPRSNINVRENVATKPGKRQTAFDFGLLTPAMLKDLFDATFVRIDRATGLAVFDLKYKSNMKDNTRNRVFLDPQRKVMVRREWYSQIDNRLQATFVYTSFSNVGGVNFPVAFEVRNAENKVAGSMKYENLKVNVSLDDALFKL